MTNAELARRLSALDWSNTSLQHQLAISAAVDTLSGTPLPAHHCGAARHVDNVIDLTEVFQRERTQRGRTVALTRLDGTPFTSRAFTPGPADAPWAWIAETVSKELGVAPEAVGCVDPNWVTVDGLPVYCVDFPF